MMNVKPLGYRILIERVEEAEVKETTGGIIIPDTAREKPQIGKVLAVGEGKRDEHGKRIPLELSVDDVIYFGKCTGSEIKLNGKEYLVMREEDVIAKTL